MYTHEPENYKCPLCAVIKGVEGDFPYTKQADIFYKDDVLTAIVASHGWPTNKGHILIFPNVHIENIYEIPEEILSQLHIFAKRAAIALKEVYKCDGTTIRQNNEPSGDQDLWHYHIHVFPRYPGDNINQIPGLRQVNDPRERVYYSEKLKTYFDSK